MKAKTLTAGSITVACPHCLEPIDCASDPRGKTIQCEECKQLAEVPYDIEILLG